jgi:hypothetical protein
MKKLLAFLLALIVIALPLVACGEKEDKIEGPYAFSEEATDYVRLKVVTKKNNKLEDMKRCNPMVDNMIIPQLKSFKENDWIISVESPGC